VLEFHQLDAAPETLCDLGHERRASQLNARAGGRSHLGGKRLTRGFVETEGMVEEEFRETAGREEREAAVVTGTAASVSTITVEPVPSKQCRVGCGPGPGLDRIPCDFANMPDGDHGRVTTRCLPHAA
jgi:hypothetical protein